MYENWQTYETSSKPIEKSDNTYYINFKLSLLKKTLIP